ncbi:peptidoglycan-binding protein [Paractinoplanes globisporus]|uniref:Peptidoglycan-binding protein n=1 Tax=Paractinoplanes globisporus TaxID=113565 RepID=A0ABW6W6R6_9ACTN|nr:peptidoglycan-binding protein [Actinoplanes globisporus]
MRRAVGATATILGLAAAGTWWAMTARPDTPAPAAEVETGTAAVTRGSVAERTQYTGTLGFDGSYPVANHGDPGVLTAVARAGSTVNRGGVLYRVADRPARLLFGPVPAYRDLRLGVAAGPDVKELETNLVALGMDRDREMTVDDTFTAATAAAIRRWQAVWGLPARRRTGQVPLGSVVFEPGPLRVDQVRAAPGTSIGPGAEILIGTSTRPVVACQIPVAERTSVTAGDKVEITVNGLPGTSTGTVTSVARTATAPGPQGDDQGAATVTVTIRVTLPRAAQGLDEAPTGVSITTASRSGVLLVPILALLPRSGGGYQVRLASGGFVPVTPGLFDDVTGTVEVGGDLTPGQLVQVPAS